MDKSFAKLYRFIFTWVAILEPLWGYYLVTFKPGDFDFSRELIWDRVLISVLLIYGVRLTFKKELFEKFGVITIATLCTIGLIHQYLTVYFNPGNTVYMFGAFGAAVFVILGLPTRKTTIWIGTSSILGALFISDLKYMFFLDMITYIPLLMYFKLIMISNFEKIEMQTKMVTMGELAGGISHETNNFLSQIIGVADALDRKSKKTVSVPSKTIQKYSKTIKQSAENITDIIRVLRTLSNKNQKQLNKKMYSIEEIINASLSNFDSYFRTNEININLKLSHEELFVDKGAITQVFVNIIKNANDAMESTGFKTITIQNTLDENYTIVDISNNGDKIEKIHRPKIFNEFFTTKDVLKGTGLGLSISRKIVDRHGGSLELLPHRKKVIDKVKVTTFRIKLPKK